MKSSDIEKFRYALFGAGHLTNKNINDSDALFGVTNDTLWGYYDSLQDAWDFICNFIHTLEPSISIADAPKHIPQGLVVGVKVGVEIIEYWFCDERPITGYTINDLIEKQGGCTQMTLSDFQKITPRNKLYFILDSKGDLMRIYFGSTMIARKTDNGQVTIGFPARLPFLFA